MWMLVLTSQNQAIAVTEKQQIFYSFLIFDCYLYHSEIGKKKLAERNLSYFGYVVSKVKKITHFDSKIADSMRNNKKLNKAQNCSALSKKKDYHYIKDDRTKKVLGEAILYQKRLTSIKSAANDSDKLSNAFGVSEKVIGETIQSLAVQGAVAACGYDKKKLSNFKKWIMLSFSNQLLQSGMKYGSQKYNVILQSLGAATKTGRAKIKNNPSFCGKVIPAFDIAYTQYSAKKLNQAQKLFESLK